MHRQPPPAIVPSLPKPERLIQDMTSFDPLAGIDLFFALSGRTTKHEMLLALPRHSDTPLL